MLKFLLILSIFLAPALRAEQILFIGNSFTFVNKVPSLVESIAGSRGKSIVTAAVTKGGQGWAYHLKTPATDLALESKPWDWVVLQDYSLNATHAGNIDDFMKNGRMFYDRIASESPHANIILYETWAYSPRHPAIHGTAVTPPKFGSPAEMIAEIHRNYSALQAALQALDPKRKVLLAPVGTAFDQFIHEYPGINLYRADFKHPDLEGSYLAALVIYSTITGDSVQGAAGGRLGAEEVKDLQRVAMEVSKK